MRILILVLLLSACSTVSEVRVQKVPEPPYIEIPVLENAGTESDKVKALAVYITKLKAALINAVNALDVYRWKVYCKYMIYIAFY